MSGPTLWRLERQGCVLGLSWDRQPQQGSSCRRIVQNVLPSQPQPVSGIPRPHVEVGTPTGCLTIHFNSDMTQIWGRFPRPGTHIPALDACCEWSAPATHTSAQLITNWGVSTTFLRFSNLLGWCLELGKHFTSVGLLQRRELRDNQKEEMHRTKCGGGGVHRFCALFGHASLPTHQCFHQPGSSMNLLVRKSL